MDDLYISTIYIYTCTFMYVCMYVCMYVDIFT